MRKLVAMISSIVVATILGTLITTPALAVTVSKKQTVYLTSNDGTGYGSSTTINVTDLKAGTHITKGSIKVSNPSVLTAHTLQQQATKYIKLSEEGYSGSGCYDYIELKLKKPGTCKVSFKIGTKTYATTVVVKKYTNPIKKFTIAGVQGGKNLASAFKNSASAYGAKAVNKKGAISVVPATGWSVFRLEYSNLKTRNGWHRYVGGGTSSLSMSIPSAINQGSICIYLINNSTGGTIIADYYLR